ncbi:MAG: hypothetical protein ABIE43_02130 [Patescibacteria group bacterium]
MNKKIYIFGFIFITCAILTSFANCFQIIDTRNSGTEIDAWFSRLTGPWSFLAEGLAFALLLAAKKYKSPNPDSS